MGRSSRRLPAGHSFHITLRCNSRKFLIAKGLRRDVLLAVLAKAKQKVPHKLYAVCLMANHLHLLLRPDDASELPKLMHWIGWYSAMALNRLSGRCGHFWEARYYASAIAPKDHQRALSTLRYIHANPKAAGVRKGFYDPYSNYGHYSRLETDGITQWHPAFLQLAPTLTGCSKRYEHFCRKYRCKSKPIKTRRWGSKLIARLKCTTARAQGNSKRHRSCIGQQSLPLNLPALRELPEDWQQVASTFSPLQCTTLGR
ncbi:transposase IS200 like family protein [Synechococcus sp. SYN20]|uniref:transposase n=1 Tax=Synechococcus sp. SYN20 TaxID=1050714 RepID=UPI001645D040|nr:transposase [Synechococcus sp. SYN20]QNJ25255.1 transposase IS200 like family protein [Synechococcus sp. SYN20]